MFYWKQKDVLSFQDKKALNIGKHLIVGFTDSNEVKFLSRKGLIGGIYLTNRNIQNRSKQETQEFLYSLQNVRKLEGLPPLFITADQEGGMVSRLTPPLSNLPTIREYIDGSEGDSAMEKIKEFSLLQSKELSELGVNVNFSPVVDLYSPDSDHFDLHTQIWRRSISNDPELTSKYALEYSKISNLNKIITTYKHFPGIGKVKTDTHFFTASVEEPLEDLFKKDIFPFLALKDFKGFSWIMLSHTKIPEIDPNLPCSYSDKVINQILREKIGFQGVLITDDLSMGPSYYNGIEKSAYLALKNGADFLLISYDKDLFYPIFHKLYTMEDPDFENKLNQSNKRIERYYSFVK